MKTLAEAVVEAQTLVTDLQALEAVPVPTPVPTPVSDPIVSITVTHQSGATQEFVPKA